VFASFGRQDLVTRVRRVAEKYFRKECLFLSLSVGMLVAILQD